MCSENQIDIDKIFKWFSIRFVHVFRLTRLHIPYTYSVMVAIAKQFPISVRLLLWLGNITNQITDWIDSVKRFWWVFAIARPIVT